MMNVDDILLSPHFHKNWDTRMGCDPSPEAVMAVIRSGIRVHSGRELRDLSNQRFVMLAVYWHPDLDIVISVDTTMRPWRAVSVLSRDNWRRRQERKIRKPKRRKHDKPGGRLRRKPTEKKWRFR